MRLLYTGCQVTLCQCLDHVCEAFPSQKCYMNMVLILSGYGYMGHCSHWISFLLDFHVRGYMKNMVNEHMVDTR